MKQVLIDHIKARGNQFFRWYPEGMKMSGVVVGNPGIRKGRWLYDDGSTWRTR